MRIDEETGVGKEDITIRVFNKCNNNCIMCSNNTRMLSNVKRQSDNTLLKEVFSIKNLKQISLTGGEPTLNKNLINILRFINTKSPEMQIALLSNGRMFSYQDYVKKFLGIKNLTLIIPICGSNSVIHDSITRTKGSFNETRQGIKNLLARSLNLELRVVIHRLNYKDLPNIAKLILKEFKKVSCVVFLMEEIMGNAADNKKILTVSYSDVLPYLRNAVSLLHKKSIEARLYHFPLCTLDRELWPVAWRTVRKSKIIYPNCTSCRYKDCCVGVLKTYYYNVNREEFRPIKEKVAIIKDNKRFIFHPISKVK